ncbi:MAG: STAS domain-containing protein [Deltaproteobacteria bacterium]|nr:STAS domain-containing protein [Deltaproteobacteria bacterium]
MEGPDRLVASASEDFRKLVNGLVDQGKTRLVIDMGKTEFMDSSGLGALVSRIAATRANHGDVRLAAPSPQILNLLQITHLDKVFQCFDHVDSAVKSFD